VPVPVVKRREIVRRIPIPVSPKKKSGRSGTKIINRTILNMGYGSSSSSSSESDESTDGYMKKASTESESSESSESTNFNFSGIKNLIKARKAKVGKSLKWMSGLSNWNNKKAAWRRGDGKWRKYGMDNM